MKLDVATWPEGTTDKEVTEQPEDLDLTSEVNRIDEPVKVRLSVQKSVDEVIVTGRVSADQGTRITRLDRLSRPGVRPLTAGKQGSRKAFRNGHKKLFETGYESQTSRLATTRPG